MYRKQSVGILLITLLLASITACTYIEKDPNMDFDIPELTEANSIAFTANITEQFPVEIHLRGKYMAVDWGDGRIEKRPDTAEGGTEFQHAYKRGSYRVKVWSEQLQFLNISNVLNSYTELSIGNCPMMETMYITNIDGLKVFDGSCCPHVFDLNIGSMPSLTTIDLSPCRHLQKFGCFTLPKITSLDLSENGMLHALSIMHTGIKDLKLGNQRQLGQVSITESPLTSIDLAKAPLISQLEIRNTPLSAINVGHLKELTNLYLPGNGFATLDLTANTKLWTLDCSNNKLTTLLLQENTPLKSVHINHNLLSAQALNNIFSALRTNYGIPVWDIKINNNPGTDTCDKNIVLNKGWKIADKD